MDPSSPHRKKQRLSQDAARRSLLAAGKRLLLERGLDHGLGLVTLNDAVIESGVPRASAYRIFGNDEVDPQVAFRTELLTTYINDDPLEYRRRAVETVVTDALTALAKAEPGELAVVLRETVRIAFAGTVAPLADDPNWRVVGPSWAATALTEWAPTELVDAHRTGMNATVGFYIPLYQQVVAAAGLRPRPAVEWKTWAILAQSAVISASFFTQYYPELQTIMRPTGPHGGLQPWSHAAVLAEGLVLAGFEPDPEAEASADLSTWTAPSTERT